MVLDHTGEDEIGRIGQAIAGLRRNAQALAETRRHRERVRRRQETVISSELMLLADSIDPTTARKCSRSFPGRAAANPKTNCVALRA